MKTLLRFIDRQLPRGGLKRSVSILAGGTVVAQAIAFAVSPILTRLYRVEDFGYLQVFNSIVGVLLIVVAGRYEMAIPLPEDDETAVNLLGFAVCMVAAVSSLVGLLLLVAVRIAWIDTHSGRLLPYLWLIPVCLAGAGYYQVFSFWSLRGKRFALIAQTRVVQVASRFLLQLGAALLKFGLPGLLVGETIARANGTGSFVQGFWKENRELIAKLKWQKMVTAAKRYMHFPFVLSASGLLNAATLAFPGLFLVGFFGPTVTGWFALVDRVLGIPSVLIGQSLQQVYVSEGAPLIHSDPIGLKHLFIKMIRKIYFIPFLTCTFFILFGPAVFALIFGEKWREAGEYARILAFVDIAGLLVAPIDMTLTMLEMQNWRFCWDCGRFVLLVGVMFGAHHIFRSARSVICAYAGTLTFCYAILIGISYIGINRLIERRSDLTILTD
jgi:O-antigen/teichoic acid export membrane protein